MEFGPEKETLLQKIAFPCVALSLLVPTAIGFGIGYLLMSFFGKMDALDQVFEKPIVSSTLNDLLGAFGTFCILLCFGWLGKFAGTMAMQETSDWFEEREKSAMALTEEDIRVFECPQCKKSDTYRTYLGPDRNGKYSFKCSTPDCGRERSEDALAREIHRKD